MDITDFLPKYPNIDNTKYKVLNPYEDDFYKAIFHKKEFYENKLEKDEPFPNERGMLTKYQKTIARYLSSNTPYDKLLLVHSMGLGKCVLPDTKITIINEGVNQHYRIKDIWNTFSSVELSESDNSGIWSTPIKKLYINSYDEKAQKVVVAQIHKLYKQYIEEKVRTVVLEDGNKICMTNAHKLYTSVYNTEHSLCYWQNDLDVDDYVAVKNINKPNFVDFKKIISIDEYSYRGFVYDFEILIHHNYFANSILTHNTCSAIGAVEQVKGEESTFKGAVVLAKGDTILDNFKRELVEKCTVGQYIPNNYKNLTELERIHAINKKTSYYEFNTFMKFAKDMNRLKDEDIVSYYSNRVIVIDEVHNLRIKSEFNENPEETYSQFHRFLHLIQNSKVLLLSGTPMKDRPEEIASIANLLLKGDDQLPTGELFLQEYMKKKGESYTLKPDKTDDLKLKLKGIISFLREAESTIPKEFIGEKNYGKLKYFIVAPNKMSSHQSKGYKDAYEKDRGGKKGVWLNCREASLFVFPDGSYGKKGFQTYIKAPDSGSLSLGTSSNSFKMKSELKNVLLGKTNEETLNNLKKYSATYADVIKNILESKGNCFIYSSLAKGSGAILFSLILELFNFRKASGKETEKGLRYAILTGETSNPKRTRTINERYNRSDNAHGEFIKVIIGSKTVSEGFSFKNVVFEAINTPHWNYSETAQALARGIRLGSHNDLLRMGENVKVKILQPVSIPKDSNSESIDLLMYTISEDKDISINSILRLLMEVAFDCGLNYLRNYVKSKDGSRECNYTSCNYTCEGIDMDEVYNGINDDELDYSTYQLYYSNPKTPLIKKKIENLFKENIKISLDSIIENLQGQFTEEEIKNSIYLLEEESKGKEFDYRKFLELYSRSNTKKISNGIEELFRNTFRLDFDTIRSFFSEYTEFEVITALQNLINNNISIMNKYGFQSYLRNENNVFFLVNSIIVNADFFAEYYCKNPTVNSDEKFEDVKKNLYTIMLPSLVSKLCKVKDSVSFASIIRTLPKQVQEMFIEASLIAQDKGVDKNEKLKDMVISYFKNYIKEVDGVWISTFLKDALMCKKVGKKHSWKPCDDKYKEIIKEQKSERLKELKEDNPYGIVGKYNPQNGAFCIVDFEQEKEIRTKISEKREKGKVDKRLNRSGKACKSWTITELAKLVIKRLKIDPPEDYLEKYGNADNVEDDVDALKRLASKATKKVIDSLYTEEEYDEISLEELKRVLYWTDRKQGGGNVKMCESVKGWLEDKGLLEIDDQCGVQGKKQVEGDKKTKSAFRIDIIVPSNRTDDFKTVSKEINKVVEEMIGIEGYKAIIDKNTWVIIYSKNKMVGFAKIEKGEIVILAVSSNYRKRKLIAKDAMRVLMKNIKESQDISSIKVDNKNKEAKKLIRIYEALGFEVDRTEDKYTFMVYK
jgi:ribosomal protein S18 acetylase RimI-like enzyme